MKEIKAYSLLICFILILGGLALGFCYVRATEGTVNITGIIASVCGNEIIETGEQCDGDNLGGQTCRGLGFRGGTLSCNADCAFNTSACTRGVGGGGGYVPPPIETKVIFQGKSYPNSLVTILKDGKIATTVQADSKADFRAEITDLTAGIYTFGVWAKDKDGIKSIAYTLTFRVSSNTTTTVSGIYLPPTIDLSDIVFQRGETLNIFGQTIPEVEVDVHILSSEIIEKTQADKIGAWFLPFNTQLLEDGLHITKARFQLNDEERSGFSQLLSFYWTFAISW